MAEVIFVAGPMGTSPGDLSERARDMALSSPSVPSLSSEREHPPERRADMANTVNANLTFMGRTGC
jgi:hypothetical protein